MKKPRIYTTSFAAVYPLYVSKAEKKGRTRAEVDQIISWLTGYSKGELEAQLEKQTDVMLSAINAPDTSRWVSSFPTSRVSSVPTCRMSGRSSWVWQVTKMRRRLNRRRCG